MTARIHQLLALLLSLVLFPACNSMTSGGDPLPSWTEGSTKQAILDFVRSTTDESNSDYIPPEDRIAVFDNDGTLWSEKPMYFQLVFILDRVKAMASKHPEWKTQEPFRSALAGDLEAVAKQGEKAIFKLLSATHGGMTTVEYNELVVTWLEAARHPRFDRPYTELVFQPMLELLACLRANGYATWIVSGGGQDFMRPWAPGIYGIPPQQIIGSQMDMQLEERNGEPVLVKALKLHFLDDKAGKVISIHRFLGKRPVAAFGNSDGDLEMLRWSAARPGRSLQVLIHHTDDAREWAYDRDSHVGRLDKGLEAARKGKWVLVDMKRDWSRVYPFTEQN
jgi:phosphoglycolate phosphatase-like HAD superfamily hydrolase